MFTKVPFRIMLKAPVQNSKFKINSDFLLMITDYRLP
jgi:hypothetical protein